LVLAFLKNGISMNVQSLLPAPNIFVRLLRNMRVPGECIVVGVYKLRDVVIVGRRRRGKPWIMSKLFEEGCKRRCVRAERILERYLAKDAKAADTKSRIDGHTRG
jgi:hypothetical protein